MDAVACMLFVLVDGARTKEALEVLLGDAEYQARFPFEYAYCLYKEGRVQEALEQLGAVPEHRALDRKRLEGQLSYRLEDYDGCIRTYTEIFKAPFGETSVEAKANLVAAYVGAQRSGEIASALAEAGLEF